MEHVDSARALIAIDAVVFDTETTGLDPAHARIVEMGGVRIAAGRLEESETFHQLVHPGMAIPAASSAIHGIVDADVARAPHFGEALPRLLAFAGDRIWIGHSIGFDFAILKKEAARAGLAFEQKPALDTRLLAQIVAPQLPGFSMETLCAWLNVEPAKRHSALGDAQSAARIFLALVPHLRDRGIRTIGEALRASSRLTQALEAEHAAGWAAIGDPPPTTIQIHSRIDAYPYRHRAAEIMSCPPRFASPFETVDTALAMMMREKISSLFIRGAQGEEKAQSCGIVTERDLLRAMAAEGGSALARPLESIASRPVHKVAADSFLHVAMARMTHLRIRHLAVTDSDDRIIGALSARDLLRLRAGDALSLGDSIEMATDARGLAAAWSGLPRTCAALVAEGMNGAEIASVISQEICAMTARAVTIAQEEMRRAGAGEAPCPFAFLVLGSAARGESLLAMDQDNALVFAHDDAPSHRDDWFAELAARISDLLHEAGVPLCKGGIMARNPLWRGSLETWRRRIETWVTRSDPGDLLSVDVFFDMRFVAGDASLAESLRMDAMALAQGRPSFAKLLVESSGAAEPAFNLFGRLRLKDGRIDLKRAGLFRLVCAARALAIKHGIGAHATAERLSALRAMKAGGDHDLEHLIEAQRFFLTHILRQQIHDIGLGAPPSNRIEPARLSGLERERLRESLHAIEALETLVRELLFSD